MATEVFHMDANGVRISAHRSVFGEHTYATRNIQSVDRVEDKGVRWPGIGTLSIGLAVAVVGLVLQHTITLMIGAVAVLSGTLNLSRKRPRYGIRITTHRGPVYVLASRDKRYVEVVADALLRAVSVAHRSREAVRGESGPGDEGGPGYAPATDMPATRRGGRPTRRRRRR